MTRSPGIPVFVRWLGVFLACVLLKEGLDLVLPGDGDSLAYTLVFCAVLTACVMWGQHHAASVGTRRVRYLGARLVMAGVVVAAAVIASAALTR